MGAKIAEQTQPVSYYKGTLYVWVKSPSWMQELTYFAKDMKDKINVWAGEEWIYFIRFTLDRRSLPKTEENQKHLQNFLSKQFPNEGEGR